MQADVVGVWKLTSFVMENVDTKDRSEPFGPAPRGVLMLHPDGRMAALVTPGGLTAPADKPEPAPAFQKLIAYSGRYRLEPPDRFVTAVDVAWVESWVDTEQARTYRLDGDRLELFTPPGRIPLAGGHEATVIGILSWVRDAAAPAEANQQASG